MRSGEPDHFLLSVLTLRKPVNAVQHEIERSPPSSLDQRKQSPLSKEDSLPLAGLIICARLHASKGSPGTLLLPQLC
jgi:hypothetical protein